MRWCRSRCDLMKAPTRAAPMTVAARRVDKAVEPVQRQAVREASLAKPDLRAKARKGGLVGGTRGEDDGHPSGLEPAAELQRARPDLGRAARAHLEEHGLARPE